MRNTLVIAGASIALALTAFQASAAPESVRSYSLSGFDKIAAAGHNTIVVSVGGAPGVRASGDPAVLDKMEVVVRRGALHIRPKEQYRQNFSWRLLPRATYRVTMPKLVDAALAGSGGMTIDRVGGSDFSAAVAGSGEMRIANLAVDDAAMSVAGSGNLIVAGRARSADLSVAGSGKLSGRDLSVGTASVSMAGSGIAEVEARQTADVSVVGSGRVDVSGSPRCSVSRIGPGKVRCGA
ncbi:head GIN domain-containing protein [Tsuneonella sp. HG222]